MRIPCPHSPAHPPSYPHPHTRRRCVHISVQLIGRPSVPHSRRMVRPHQCATDWQAIHTVNTRWKALAHTYLYIPATFVYVRYVSHLTRRVPCEHIRARARPWEHGFLKMRWFSPGNVLDIITVAMVGRLGWYDSQYPVAPRPASAV